MRVGSNAPSYLLGDHLGSTSLTASSTGSKVAELRYHPWGGTRFTSGTTPTARRYTGQIEDAAIGLYPSATSGQAFYNARYYDGALGRFIQADTIVPSPANPQSLNRYSYVVNNPLRYTDPTGHFEDEAIINYLKQHYEHWWDIWTAWLQNEAWMSMLREAVAGDIFAALNDGEPIWFEFCGEGKSVLSGAVMTSQPINGKPAGQVALGDYQSGALGTPIAGLLRRNRVGGGYSVKETLPYVQPQSPTGFHFELSTREVSQGEATTLKIARIALIALTTGKVAAALEVKWGVAEAFAAAVAVEYGIDLLWNDYGYQAGDREIAINGHITHYANRGFAGASSRAYTLWYRPASYSR